VRLEFLTTSEDGCEIEPREGVTHSADFVRDVFTSKFTHFTPELRIGPQFVEMSRDSRGITEVGEETVLAMLDL
jgi:hypothetical protein